MNWRIAVPGILVVGFGLGLICVGVFNAYDGKPKEPEPEPTPSRFTVERVDSEIDIVTDMKTHRQYLSRSRGGFIEIIP